MYVTQRFGMLGGAERHLLTLVNAFAQTRPVELVSLVGGTPLHPVPALDQKVDWTRLNVGWQWPWKVLWTLWFLLWLPGRMRRRVAIVHTHSTYANVIGGIAARIAGIQGHIATVHGISPVVHASRSFAGRGLTFHGWLYRWADWLTGKIAHRIIVPSESTKAYLVHEVGVNPDRVEVIYNGIQAAERTCTSSEARRARRRAWGLDDRGRVVGMVAHLFPVKGHRYFIEAAQLLSSTWPDVTFWIVGGTGNFPPDPLYELGALLVRKGRLRFLGDRQDARAIFGLMDIVVVPSLTEGCPYAVLEALGAGCPVVASAVGGIPEIIQHEHTGFLVPPADSAALSHAIETLLLNPARAEQLGHNGRCVVTEVFTEARMVSATSQLYQRACRSQCR